MIDPKRMEYWLKAQKQFFQTGTPVQGTSSVMQGVVANGPTQQQQQQAQSPKDTK